MAAEIFHFSSAASRSQRLALEHSIRLARFYVENGQLDPTYADGVIANLQDQLAALAPEERSA